MKAFFIVALVSSFCIYANPSEPTLKYIRELLNTQMLLKRRQYLSAEDIQTYRAIHAFLQTVPVARIQLVQSNAIPPIKKQYNYNDTDA